MADTDTYPVLWSFRRCPYAIRARLAVQASGMRVWLREILLRDKPAAFIATSAKATVPVLCLADDRVIEESRDIMLWALRHSDPQGWLTIWQQNPDFCSGFLDRLDGPFKHHLDRYKYASRFDGDAAEQHRHQGGLFLAEIDQSLAGEDGFLSGQAFGILDAASLPFIRQFRGVDITWFDAQPWPFLHAWLAAFLGSDAFANVMHKYPPWRPPEDGVRFPC